MDEPPILLVCGDLIFQSKVAGTARALGRPVRLAPTVAAAVAAATPETRLALVDLSSPANTTTDDLRALRAALPPTARLLAYGSHVEADRLREARAAGCDPVLPRSAFVERLTELLWRAGSDADDVVAAVHVQHLAGHAAGHVRE